MRGVNDVYRTPPELCLGTRPNTRVPDADQKRQRGEVEEILLRLKTQPGVILADEVGMGKTFVALAAGYSVAQNSPRGPVVIMVPAHLVDKWEQDLATFCGLYLDGRKPVRDDAPRKERVRREALRYGVARDSVGFMKLLDDPAAERCRIIFLTSGAMATQQNDKWVRLALIRETLNRHARGRASRLIQVRQQIHRFLGQLLWALTEERAQELGDELWERLLRALPDRWKDIYNDAVRDERRRLTDDPVPKAVTRALPKVELKPLAEALEEMPVRARGGDDRITERLDVIRKALRKVEGALWRDVIAATNWRSPLLIMDEAHHLKNPAALLARQLQSPDLDGDLRTGDGAMARAFDRMLFLTATPFQLGHPELVRVLQRFGDVRWEDEALGNAAELGPRLAALEERLNASQRASIALQRAWSRLRPEDVGSEGVDVWWARLIETAEDELSHHQRAVVDAYRAAKKCRVASQEALRPWIVRHNKGVHWPGSTVQRRQRRTGAAIAGIGTAGGLRVPPEQLLPFFLAARSAVHHGKDLLGEALCSSYEAFRLTRKDRKPVKDDQYDAGEVVPDLSHAEWYLGEFDRALEATSGGTHPKMQATVRRVVDLWAAGEKVLVFAFYRHTCRALRRHISREIETRLVAGARERVAAGTDVDALLDRIQRSYFDDTRSSRRRAVDAALEELLAGREEAIRAAGIEAEQRERILDVMRRFLRVRTTLARCFPLAEVDSIEPAEAVRAVLDHKDGMGSSWREKFERFVEFLARECLIDERRLYLEAALHTQTGGIRVEGEADEGAGTITLANVQVATGETQRETRSRLMRAFNTPFFPDVLVCSEVMGEGVDLQRFCRHVIHHDLAWNPSSIEQRTGRIDRLGCAAEGRHSIEVYLPYLAGTADERQFQVMSEREQWFRVVMGQDKVAELIAPDSAQALPLPETVVDDLSFELGV